MFFAAALTSCQKERCYDHDHGVTDANILRVQFGWNEAPDANPATMRLAVFSEGAQPVQVPFSGKAGGEVKLNDGAYSLIGYNSDTEVLGTRGDNWNDFEVYSLETQMTTVSRLFATTRNVPKSRGTEEQPLVFEPDELWTSAVGNVTVHSQGVATVTMPMEVATCEYVFTINNVPNIEYITGAAATVSGMSGSWYPARGSSSDDQCIMPFEMQLQGGVRLSGKVRTFGHCPYHEEGDEHQHQLTVYFELTTGQKYYYSFDVTDTLHDGKHWFEGGTETYIELDEIPIPKPLTNGTGLQPNVDEWMEVPIVLNM